MSLVALAAGLMKKAAALLGLKAWEHAKVVHAEKKGYAGDADTDSGGMNASFDETYQRLLGGPDSIGAKALLLPLEGRVVALDILKRPAVQGWLRLAETKSGLCGIARAKQLQVDSDESVFCGLAKTYAAHTGEAEELATGVINAVVAGLLAGYRQRLDEQSVVVGVVEEQGAATREAVTSATKKIDDLISATHPSGLSEREASGEAKHQLQRILNTRSFATDSSARIRDLADQVDCGRLAKASSELKDEIYIWAARLLTNDATTIAQARTYLARVTVLRDGLGAQIARAVIKTAEGDAETALQSLQDIDDPDARAAFLFALERSKGQEGVIRWYEFNKAGLSASSLTAMGWARVASAFAGTGQWERAVDSFDVALPLANAFPDLYFFSAAHCAALTVPADQRGAVLMGAMVYGQVETMDGVSAENYRRRAIDLYALAERHLEPLSPERAEFAGLCRLLLRLGSRDEHVSTIARSEVEAEFEDIGRAVKLYPVIRNQGFSLDTGTLTATLQAKLVLQGLSRDEWSTLYMLVSDTFAPADVVAFLEEHGRKLESVIEAKPLAHRRISALLATDGHGVRARSELLKHKDLFEDIEYRRIEAQILDAEGTDVGPQLRTIYDEDPSFVNLKLLVEHLAARDEADTLLPLAAKLYELAPTVQHAGIVVACLRRGKNGAPDAVVRFLQSAKEIVSLDPRLQSELAWSSLQLGDWRTAKEVNDRLIELEPDSERHSGLDINIAVKSGDWEHFSTIFEREWALRESRSASMLLLLASLAADGPFFADRAFELARLAAEKSNDDASTLAAAYQSAVQLGMENEMASRWLHRAADDSSGVVGRTTMRKIVEEIMPEQARRAEVARRVFEQGAMPFHFLAPLLNAPLARFYISIPAANLQQLDPRKRVSLPFFGARGGEAKIHLPSKTSLGLDLTAILVTEMLGVLPAVLDSFHKVYIAADTMRGLLSEKRRTRFQQPSEIALATRLLSAISTSVLKPAREAMSPPQWLTDEVGIEHARLLEHALISGGVLVTSIPLLKLSSLGEDIADLREYGSLVVSPRTFVQSLRLAGLLSEVSANAADEYISRVDSGAASGCQGDLTKQVVLLDMVAARHLANANVFDHADLSGLNLVVPEGARNNLEQTIREAEERDRTVATLDRARKTLRAGLMAGKVSILAERPSSKSDDLAGLGNIEAAAVKDVLRSGDGIDVFVVDDRYLTRLNAFTDASGRNVPVVHSLDLIAALENRAVISPALANDYRFRMREMGFAFVGTSEDELWALTDACSVDEEGNLRESREIKALRRSQILSCLAPLTDEHDRHFLSATDVAIRAVICRLWTSDAISVERAWCITTWLNDELLRPLWTNASAGREADGEVGVGIAASAVAILLVQSTLWNVEKGQAFRELVGHLCLRPAMPSNTRFLDAVASQVCSLLDAQSEEGNEKQDTTVLFRAILPSMPSMIRKRIEKNPKLGQYIQAATRDVLNFAGGNVLPTDELYDAATAASAREHGQPTTGDDWYRIVAEDGSLRAEFRKEGHWERIEIHELSSLFPSVERRVKAFEQTLAVLGPTFSERQALRDIVRERPLTLGEFKMLFALERQSVSGRWRTMFERRSGDFDLEVIAPRDEAYYLAFAGPGNRRSDAHANMRDSIMPYRGKLVGEGLDQGVRIALSGYLHPFLSPSQCVRDVADDDLLAVLDNFKLAPDPYTVAGVAEIAMSRGGDPRFMSLADDCTRRLLGDNDMPPVMYEALSLFAQTVLGQIQQCENAMAWMPYWKRIASWMQAGIVLQTYSGLQLNLSTLQKWLAEHQSDLVFAATLVDAHRDPFGTTIASDPQSCRDHVAILLHGAANEHEADFPSRDRLDAYVQNRLNDVGIAARILGPGRTIEDRLNDVLPDSAISEVHAQLEADCTSGAWNSLAILAQFLSVPRAAYADGEARLNNLSLSETDHQWLAKIVRISSASLLATCTRDAVLAAAIRDFALRATAQADSEERALQLLNLIAVAAGAHEDEDSRKTWLRESFERIARLIPKGAPSAAAVTFEATFFKALAWPSGPASMAELYSRMAA
jgi:tetratricopeptide (TPR) repeat protein